MEKTEMYWAVVEKVIANGSHGPYVVTRNEVLGSITFSLDPKVWREEVRPEPGTYVLLSQITKKRAGWRAGSGRFVTPSDTEH